MCLGPGAGAPGAHAKITRMPRLECNHQSKLRIGLVIPNTYQAITHNSCVCNEYRALVDRHICERKTNFDHKVFKSGYLQFRKLLDFTVERVPYSTVVADYTGGKRRMYEAARQLVIGPKHLKQWSRVQMFVKPDKYPLAQIHQKAPRAIQYRTPMFNLMLASYLKPFEHAYYAMLDEYGLKVVAKSLNNLERAQNIVDASKLFDNPVFVLCDHSKFDSHVKPEHLKLVHKLYLHFYKSKQLYDLLKCQLVNRCYSKGGISYVVKGTRMSGDYDTALGNTLLNHYILKQVFKQTQHHILLDGDDSVIVMPKEHLQYVDWGLFSKMGMNTTFEVVDELTRVEFCRSRLIDVYRTPRFARDWRRAAANMGITIQNYPNHTAWLRYYAGVGLGELACSSGVPIIGVLARRLSEFHDKPIMLPEYKFKGEFKHWAEIDDTVRLDYYTQWGITPREQELIEQDIMDSDLKDLLHSEHWYKSLQHE